jgi:hypothetical protein
MSEEEHTEEVLVKAFLDCGHEKVMTWEHAHNPYRTDALNQKWFACEKCARGEKGACAEGRIYHRALDERIIYQNPERLKKYFKV